MKFDEREGATPLDPDKLEGLRHRHTTTCVELDEGQIKLVLTLCCGRGKSAGDQKGLDRERMSLPCAQVQETNGVTVDVA